jgi:YggT family protein
VENIICQLLSLYLIAVFARVILSWFPLSPDSPLSGIYTFLWRITEPLLGPLRSILPPMGGLDLSPLVLMFGATFLQRAICG